jgi:hypothetical protein
MAMAGVCCMTANADSRDTATHTTGVNVMTLAQCGPPSSAGAPNGQGDFARFAVIRHAEFTQTSGDHQVNLMPEVTLLNQQHMLAVMPHLALARQRQQAGLSSGRPQAVDWRQVFFHAAHFRQQVKARV